MFLVYMIIQLIKKLLLLEIFYVFYSFTNVLLNTSFNIRGYPILSTIEDALYALENTEMDYVVIEDYLFTS